MDMKQTAVEWLVEQLARKHNEFQALTFYYDHKDEIEQAKQMEKEQMEKCFLDGDSDGFRRCYYHGYDGLDFEQYYNETYGK